MSTPLLFQPISFRSVTARNRIVVAPMCQYSAEDGLGDDWHVQHLGARAMGGAGIVFTEATHVSAISRITHHCLGLWNTQHQALLTRLAAIITRGGAVPGIQIAHAGRKASTTRTWGRAPGRAASRSRRTTAAGCRSRRARSPSTPAPPTRTP
jgi:2,4-dienoyl-CoA reductase-like NADH-dependent reductase (Old Yellow Enzyme family)